MQPSNFPDIAEADTPAANLEFDRFAMERLVLFSDAVYAIIITLLALDVRLPEAGADASLTALLIQTLPKLGSYALSFLVVAALWRVHLRRFRYFVAIDSTVITGNIVQLLLTGLLPFSTSVLNGHLSALAVTIYAGNMIAISLVAWLTWWYARRQPQLVSPRLDAAWCESDDRRTLLTLAVFGICAASAWLNPIWATLSLVLLWPGNAFLSRVDRRAELAHRQAADEAHAAAAAR